MKKSLIFGFLFVVLIVVSSCSQQTGNKGVKQINDIDNCLNSCRNSNTNCLSTCREIAGSTNCKRANEEDNDPLCVRLREASYLTCGNQCGSAVTTCMNQCN